MDARLLSHHFVHAHSRIESSLVLKLHIESSLRQLWAWVRLKVSRPKQDYAALLAPDENGHVMPHALFG
eukprot:14409-Rhodomonas_salina.1